MAHLFIFGLGYTAQAVKLAIEAKGWKCSATSSAGDIAFHDEAAVSHAIATATHVLSSVPPDAQAQHDPVLARYGDLLASPDKSEKWVGYLSSTGVYGDTGGAWVDETAPIGRGRRSLRAEMDAAWIALGARVFRLPGIYGQGRSALDRVAQGRAHRIDLPGQVFSRIHVDDIASGVIAGFDAPAGAYNLADDLPASQNDVIAEACRLLGQPLPPLQSLDQAGLSPAARAFYGENRRIANGKARRVLGWQPRHPTYRSGLRAILAESSATGGGTTAE